MKLQRYELYYNGFEYDGMREKDDGEFCAFKDVEALEADNAALHAECDRLTAMLGPQKPMSAEEVTQPGFYCWKFADHRWVIVIARYDDSRIVIKTILGDEIFIGKFIGPIKMPEVQ